MPLYACLRTPASPGVALTVAKEFSPRVQRYGSDCVVLDVSGLGRLLGDPQTIGRETPARCARHVTGRGSRDLGVCRGFRGLLILRTRVARVAVAPTQAGALLCHRRSRG